MVKFGKMSWPQSKFAVVVCLLAWTILALLAQVQAQVLYNVTTTKNTTAAIYRGGPSSYRRNIGGRPYPSIIQMSRPSQADSVSPDWQSSEKKTSIRLPSIVVTSRPFGSLSGQSRPTPPQTTTSTTPSSLVDKSTPNIPFFTISCSVGRPCSKIISSTHVKTARPTFKPYTKEDYEKFKGPLSALFPPSRNKVTTTSPAIQISTTTPRPRTTSRITTRSTTTTTTTTTTTEKPEKINDYTPNFNANKYYYKPSSNTGSNKRPDNPSLSSAASATLADLEYDPFSFNKPSLVKQPWIWPIDRNTNTHNEDINNNWHKKPTWVNGKLTYRPPSAASTEPVERDYAPTTKPTVHYSNKPNFYSSSFQPQPYRTKPTHAPFYQSWNSDNRHSINYASLRPTPQSYSSTFNGNYRDPWYAERTVTANASTRDRPKPHPLLITRNNVESAPKLSVNFDVPPEVSISSAQVQLQVVPGPKARVIEHAGFDIETDGESVNLSELIMSHYPVPPAPRPSNKLIYRNDNSTFKQDDSTRYICSYVPNGKHLCGGSLFKKNCAVTAACSFGSHSPTIINYYLSFTILSQFLQLCCLSSL